MERDFEKDIIELDAAIKSNAERDNTFTLSVLQRAKELLLRQKEMIENYEEVGWIPVEQRSPLENEYRAICSAHSSKPFLRRLEIAYITDTTEYQFGYYDGYKWIDKRNKEITNVVAWKIHEPFNP